MKVILHFFVLTVLVLCACPNMVIAQSVILTNTDGGIDGALCNTYTVTFDPLAAASAVLPNSNGEAVSGDIGVDISGDPNSNVTITMTLPKYLIGSQGTIALITFPTSGSSAGVHLETGNTFNPSITNTFNLGSGGAATLRLGYVVTIQQDASLVGQSFNGLVVYTDGSSTVTSSLIVNTSGGCDTCVTAVQDTCEGGVADNFSTSNGSEPSSPSAALAAVTGGVFKGFDNTTDNMYFLHTLNCWTDSCTVVGATLTFRVRASSSGDPTNDAIHLRQNGSTVVWADFLSNLPGAGGTWNNSQEATFTLDLENLPPSSIPAYATISNILVALQDGDLDVAIQDDSYIDFMNLDVSVCCPTGLEGIKFYDENNDQIQNIGETEIPNWTIYLDDATGANLTSTFTDAQGKYSFKNLVQGTYILREEYKSGWTQTTPLSVINKVAVQDGQTVTGLNFGNVDSCITSFVDTCFGGVADNFSSGNGSEPSSPSAALAAVTGGLFKGFDENVNDRYFLHTFNCWTDSCTVVGAVLTFNVRASSTGDPTNDAIHLRQNGSTIVWADFLSNLPGAGGTWNTNQVFTFTLDLGNLPTSSIAAYGNITNILASLQDGDLDVAIQDDSQIDFMNLELTLCCPTVLEGLKFNDENGDQFKNPTESGIGNWTIFLDDATGANITSTVTNSVGVYRFKDLTPGNYTLREEYQNGWAQTTPFTVVHKVTLQSGQTIASLDFGNADSCFEATVDTCLGGVSDNYSTSNGSEPSSPSAALLAVTGGLYKGFDNNTDDRYFLHTFSCWSDSCTVVGATLTFRVRASSVGGSTNDAIHLRQNGSTLVWADFLSNLPGAGGTWNNNQDATFTLDLANLPTSSIQSVSTISNVLASLQDGDFDVAIQDDSQVDYMNLELTLCCKCGGTMSIKNVLVPGWNLVSLPLQVQDYSVSTLYPSATSSAYAYDHGYVTTNTMDNCGGYWLKVDSTKSQIITGEKLCNISCTLRQGWNIIGSSSLPVDVTSIFTEPAGAISSQFFGYDNGYFSEATLQPAKGYWVKASQDAKMILKQGFANKTTLLSNLEPDAKHRLLTFTVTDAVGNKQKLFVTKFQNTLDKQMNYELPPPPPEGSLDVRFASQKFVEVVSGGKEELLAINISSSAYPITISWETTAKLDGSASLVIENKEINVKAHSSSRINQPQGKILLKLNVSSGIPKEYALHQAYPNPFNPSTTIAFDLPKDAMVTLKVYDVLGREVAELLNNQQYEAGQHEVLFNANNFASGLYFYRISAQHEGNTFTDLKKMILLK